MTHKQKAEEWCKKQHEQEQFEKAIHTFRTYPFSPLMYMVNVRRQWREHLKRKGK